MGKPKGDLPSPQAQEPTVSEPATLAPAATETAPPEPSKSEAGTVAALPQPELQPQPEPVAATPAATPEPVPPPVASAEPAPIAAMVEAPRLDTTTAASATPMPTVEVAAADLRSDETVDAPAAPSLLSGWTTSLSLDRARRLAPLAATFAIAAALGALGGSLATGLGGQASEPAVQSADARAVKDQVARLHAEIAALKTSIDSSAKSSSAQLIRLGDRFDRFEKAQAEPTAKLAKLTEAVERIERRAPATSLAAAAARDITGSVTALAPAPQLEPPETKPAAPPVLEGWRVRSVYNGAALIQARAGGIMEVEPGDNLPGIGRIETIRRQDGKWVVTTTKGVILTR